MFDQISYQISSVHVFEFMNRQNEYPNHISFVIYIQSDLIDLLGSIFLHRCHDSRLISLICSLLIIDLVMFFVSYLIDQVDLFHKIRIDNLCNWR